MIMKKPIEDVNVQGKKVLVRVDFNVPMDKETGTKITEITTMAELGDAAGIDVGAAVVVVLH